jgi:excisionase family DNA binding protein
MPYAYLNPDQAAQYLNLTRSDIEHLVKNGEIPHQARGERIVFGQRDLDRWASLRILHATERRLEQYHRTSFALEARHGRETFLHELTRPEWIHPGLGAKTKPSVVRDLAALAGETGHVCDPAELVSTLEAREALGSTGMPGGLALLHPSTQQPYRFEASFLVLGRTIQPIHFGAPDGQPTDLFFLLCCHEEHLHLHLLARLCLLAQEPALLQDLRSAQNSAAIYECLVQGERDVLGASGLISSTGERPRVRG